MKTIYSPFPRFRLTYSITTEASAEHGESAFAGFVTRNGEFPEKCHYIPKNPATWTLREAVEFLQDHDSGASPWHADSSGGIPPRWFSVYGNYGDEWAPDALEVSLHIPESISDASRLRLARVLGVYGYEQKGGSK